MMNKDKYIKILHALGIAYAVAIILFLLFQDGVHFEYPYNFAPEIFILALILLVLPISLFYIRKAQKKSSRYRTITTVFLILIGLISAPLLVVAPMDIFGGFEGLGIWSAFAFPATMIELVLFAAFGITILIKKLC